MTKKPKQAAKVVPLKSPKCPACGNPAEANYQPFCSARCADVDLGRWLNEDYRTPTNEAPGEGDMEADMEAEMAEAAAAADDESAEKA